jgi:hypothetical protein
VFREILGVQRHRDNALRKRWFQDAYFDLFLTQNFLGKLQWFQLCYRRDTPWERVLEWKRGLGFLHLKPRQLLDSRGPESGVLILDGLMPHQEVLERFAAAADGLPGAVAVFVADKVREYERPSFRYRRPGRARPPWLERLRKRAL